MKNKANQYPFKHPRRHRPVGAEADAAAYNRREARANRVIAEDRKFQNEEYEISTRERRDERDAFGAEIQAGFDNPEAYRKIVEDERKRRSETALFKVRMAQAELMADNTPVAETPMLEPTPIHPGVVHGPVLHDSIHSATNLLQEMPELPQDSEKTG